jgi:hypothetical protein
MAQGIKVPSQPIRVRLHAHRRPHWLGRSESPGYESPPSLRHPPIFADEADLPEAPRSLPRGGSVT